MEALCWLARPSDVRSPLGRAGGIGSPAPRPARHAGAVDHRTTEDLEAALDHIQGAPADLGRVDLVVRRPAEGEREVVVAEFLVTSIEPTPDSDLVRTQVRYDIVGAATSAWRRD